MHGLGRGVTVAAALLLAVVSGCDKVTGGGWIMTSDLTDPLEKATFGFSAKCRTLNGDSGPVAAFGEGQLEYHDDAAGVHIHGDVEPLDFLQLPGTCEDVGETFIFGIAMFGGTYRSQRGDEQGNFEVTVTDNGEPGRTNGDINGDMFCITLTGEIPYPMHCATIQGGNIQVK